MPDNPKRELAREYICNTDCHVFLTGKAGTGKTTFLHELRTSPPKRMIVAAPTGVAAINAHGETLHSFFQLPLGPYTPGGDSVQRRFRNEKIKIIKSLELLVIDEISMVRADMLDAVDSVLRRYRRNNQPFGGVQLLMIGDVHQLAPVVKRDEETLLRQHYQSLYFFGSRALQQAGYVSIELDHIYRQSDPEFIKLLNCVRNNTIDDAVLARLNQRHTADSTSLPAKQPVILTSHNRTGRDINNEQLAKLPTPEHDFEAEVIGDYPEHLYPMASTLTLKRGAQVMFTRNDHSGEKRYYNGKIGKVVHIDDEGIGVKCQDEEQSIFVQPCEWENIRYTVNPETKAIEDNVIGTFTQYPLTPAWAITIHKSQGLTFDNVIIDADAAFAHGQIYVALSRCKTLEGIVLRKPIPTQAIRTDPHVSRFAQTVQQQTPTFDQLQQAKIAYQQQLLLRCFDFHSVWWNFKKLAEQWQTNQQLVQFRANTSIPDFQVFLLNDIVQVGEKFKQQLQARFDQSKAPQENIFIQQRSQKAHGYFSEKLREHMLPWLESCNWQTDNQAMNKTLAQTCEALQQAVQKKLAGIESCKQGFDAQRYLHAQSEAEIDPQVSRKKSRDNAFVATDLEHPQLYQRLTAWRDQTAEEQQVAPYVVLHQRIVFECAESMPLTRTSLCKIKGIGKRTMEKYGDALLDIINTYCEEKCIDKATLAERKPSAIKTVSATGKLQKENTRLLSFTLFKAGNSIEQIAEQRGLVRGTIESHLAHFIQTGELAITELMGADAIEEVISAFSLHEGKGFKVVKEFLGEAYSYAQLRWVAMYMALER